MEESVARLEAAFGKRAIHRRHHIVSPDTTSVDRVRYLVELREINDEFVDQASAITVPGPAAPPLSDLLGRMPASTTLMSAYIADSSGDFDSVVALADELEQPLVSGLLRVLRAIDPSAVAALARLEDDTPSEQ
jgi:hypothetical protein